MEFKAKVALEAIKGQRTARDLAQEFGVHVNEINLWKKQLLGAASKVFSRGKDHKAERLYRKVGQPLSCRGRGSYNSHLKKL